MWLSKVANLWFFFGKYTNYYTVLTFTFREQQRRKLDREILHLEFAAQGLEGTLADKRRAAARVRNNKLLQVSFYLIGYSYHREISVVIRMFYNPFLTANSS